MSDLTADKKALDTELTRLVDDALEKMWLVGQQYDRDHPDDRLTLREFRELIESAGLDSTVVFTWLTDVMEQDFAKENEPVEWAEPEESTDG